MAYVDRINFNDVGFDLVRFTGLFNKEMNKNDLLTSLGALYNDASLQKYALTTTASTVGYDAPIPYDKFGGVCVNYDATLTNATRSVEQTNVVIGRKYSFATNELADYLTKANPELEVAKLMASYWHREMNKSLIKVLNGVCAVSAMSDLVENISTSGTISDSNRITSTTLLTALQKFGSSFEPAVFIIHSLVYKSLLGQNLISYLRVNDLNVVTPHFMGLPLYIDNSLPSSTNSTYTSYILGKKAIVTSNAKETIPFAIVNDGSVTTRQYLVMKKRFIRQPYGTNFTSLSLAGTSPTDTELATSTNWTMGYSSASYIPVIKFVSNV